MKIAIPVLLLLLFCLSAAYPQDVKPETKPDKPTLTWSGFVKAEALYDTRQVVEAREGYLLLYPKNVCLDKNGKDINAHGSFNQYAMTARLAAKATGPDILGAKAFAYIEGDFTGASNTENNSFRLRHAYIKMKWNHASLLAGQYWHPINIPEMIPNVLALNTGAPFHPYSRQPQIRLDVTKGKLNAMFAVAAQRDYANSGPAGTNTIYMRNSIIPNLNGQLQFVDEKLFAGVGIDFKRLTPRLVTDSLYATTASVNCTSYTAFVMAKTKPVVVKMQLVYGQGLNDHVIMGGYGVSKIEASTNQQEYSPLNYLSGWMTIATTGKVWQASVFAGYTKGFGSNDAIIGPVYARDADIDYVYRFAPMVSYTKGKLVIASEIELTTAAYGRNDSNYNVIDSKPVSNTRFSVSLGYFF
jgi:hypothetical protein